MYSNCVRRFVLVIAMLVGCGGDDSGSEPLRWSWSESFSPGSTMIRLTWKPGPAAID